MKNKLFINGIGVVGTQGVWREAFFAESRELDSAITPAIQPSYKELIPAAMIRRMSKGIKMGISAAQQALDEASVGMPDAIITGTGLGCSEDSEKFLRNILDNDEQYLTPTSFIQSTHNTVAAQIALRLHCKGYNFTYVNRSVSFESALLDALLQIEEGIAQDILVGGVDEISDHTYFLLQSIGQIKANDTHENIRNSRSEGVNYAEGATFFAVSAHKNEHTYAELVDVQLVNTLEEQAVGSSVSDFLQRNGLTEADIDVLILGINGDLQYDRYYGAVQELVAEKPTLYYKHLTGQYDSCSAFGLAVAASIAKRQEIDPMLLWSGQVDKTAIKYILLYNQYRGEDHSLLLVRSC